MSMNSSLSKPRKLSFITWLIGFPAKLRLLKWCIECQAALGGAGNSLWLRSRSRTSDKLANVFGGTKVKWLDETLSVFNCGNWKLGNKVNEVLAIFSSCKCVRTPAKVSASNLFKGLKDRSKEDKLGTQQKAWSSIIVIWFRAKFKTTSDCIWLSCESLMVLILLPYKNEKVGFILSCVIFKHENCKIIHLNILKIKLTWRSRCFKVLWTGFRVLMGISCSRLLAALKISSEVLWNSCSGKVLSWLFDKSTTFSCLWLPKSPGFKSDKALWFR